MLNKILIHDVRQLRNIIDAAPKIVIYGSKKFGRLLADYFLDNGMSKKLTGIVQTYDTCGHDTSYRGVQICTAARFFECDEHKRELVIVAVGNLEYQDEILNTITDLGISSCAIFPSMRVRMLYMLSECTKQGSEGERAKDRLCIFTEGQLCELAEASKQIIIYGTKENGKVVAEYLKISGYGGKLQRVVTVTKKWDTGTYQTDETLNLAPEYEGEKNLILVANDVLTYDYKPCCDIEGVNAQSCAFCVAELIDRLSQRIAIRGKNVLRQDIKFIVAGFPKCGTTSLHYAMRTVDDIFLPDCKETEYFWYKNSINDAKEKMLHRFFSNVPEGHVTGCVDPSFFTYARQVYDDFGPNIKLCFAVRNPVDATFSLFKMMNRHGDDGIYDLYKKYGTYCAEMFDEFCDWVETTKFFCFDYAAAISIFRQYYPMNQIKIIFFEELIENPETTINELLEYVGSQKKYNPQNRLPRENRGDYVWSDKTGCLLGMESFILFDEKKECLNWRIQEEPITALSIANKIENKMLQLGVRCEKAEKIFYPKMSQDQRYRLEDFYRPSVRRLEGILGRDLSQIWFE